MSRTARERFAALRQSFWRHPRVTSVSKAARGVYASGLSYCADSESDGFIPERVAVVMLAEGAKRDVAELVSAGMWSAVEGGYQVVSYLEHNQSKDELAAMRAAASEAGKRGGRPKGSAKPTPKGTLYQTLTPTLEGTPKPFERVDKADLDLEGDLEPPLRVGEDDARPDPESQIQQLLAQGPTTPASAWRLLELLTALEAAPDGRPYVNLGMASAADLTRMGEILSAARKVPDCTPMRAIAVEWSSLLALVADGTIEAPRAPAPYFRKLFGQFATMHQKAAE